MITPIEKLFQRLRALMSSDVVDEIEQPYKAELEAIGRIVAAARHVTDSGLIDQDEFICSADAGRELRAAVEAYAALRQGQNHEPTV